MSSIKLGFASELNLSRSWYRVPSLARAAGLKCQWIGTVTQAPLPVIVDLHLKLPPCQLHGGSERTPL